MGDAAAAAVLNQFAALPKTGKPQAHEHTVLAGIALSLPAAPGGTGGTTGGQEARGMAVPAAAAEGTKQPRQQRAGQHQRQHQQDEQQRRLAVVALATGTKCLGGSRRQRGGTALNDCHAEVLCRRALLRWLYGEMQAVVERYEQAAHQAAQQAAQHAAAGAGCYSDVAALAAAASTSVLRLVPPPAQAGASADGRRGEGGTGGSSGSNAGSTLFGDWRFELQPGVGVHMYVSQPPCGDASILSSIPATAGEEALAAGTAGGCEAAAAGRLAGCGASGSGGSGGGGVLGRTGAKPLKRQRVAAAGEQPEEAARQQQLELEGQRGTEEHTCRQPQQLQPHQRQAAEEAQWAVPGQHEVESYGEAQAAGLVRRKPGRGDATLSMCCSDKLARWCLLGLQGCLLSELLAAPLHLQSVTVSLQPSAPPSDSSAAQPGPAAAAPAAAAPTAEQLAAAAEAALRRSLLGRTASLAAERLPAGSSQAAPSLHIHLPAGLPGPAAAAQGVAGGGGAASNSGLTDSSSAAAVPAAALQGLGLAPSAARRVAGGFSVVWLAPTSPDFKWKQAIPKQQQQQQQQHQVVSGPSLSPATLAGGTLEAVIGGTGLKAGAAKAKPGQPVRSSAQACVCKAALFAAWQRLATALCELPAAGPACTAAPGAGNAEGGSRLSESHPLGSLQYRRAKELAGGRYRATWRRLLGPPSPLEAWIPKPPELEDFALLPAQQGLHPSEGDGSQ